MKKTGFYKILVVIAGIAIGIILGGYIGLVLGGTFLGGFDIYEKTGIEGYEIATYVGSVVGLLIAIPFISKYIRKLNKRQ